MSSPIPPRKQRQTPCPKRSYRTRREALQAINLQYSRNPAAPALYTYRCHTCRRWHMTRSAPREKPA